MAISSKNQQDLGLEKFSPMGWGQDPVSKLKLGFYLENASANIGCCQIRGFGKNKSGKLRSRDTQTFGMDTLGPRTHARYHNEQNECDLSKMH